MSFLDRLKKKTKRNTFATTGDGSDADSQREDIENRYPTKLIYFSSTTSNQNVIDNLNRWYKNFRVFNDENQCLEYLKSITEKIFLLIDDEPSKTFIETIGPLKQIDTIFVYSSSPDAFAAIISIPHSYLHYQCHDLDMLRDTIRTSTDEIEKQTFVLNMYNQKDKSIYNLSKDRTAFLYYQLFKYLLNNIPKTYVAKRMMLKTCQNYYRGDLNEFANIEDFDRNYRSADAIVWFTKDTFVNKFVNKTLRTQDLSLMYLFRFYILDLSEQLKLECEKLKRNKKDPLKIYDAVQLSQEELVNYQNSIGDLISNSEYLLTTSDYSLAYNSLRKFPEQEGTARVLIEYFVDFKVTKNVIIADITQYSPSAEQIQFLIDIGGIFQIDSCNNIENDLWNIKLHATDEGTAFIDEYIEYQKKEIAQSSVELFIGHLFLEMNEYDKAETYFDNILNSSNPNNEEIACIFYNFGRVHRLKGDFNRAIACYTRTYQLNIKAQPERPISAGKTSNALGVVYNEQGRQLKAEECFKHALDLYKKSLPKNHLNVAGTLMNLGIIDSHRKNFQAALNKYERAMKIYDDVLPPFHPNRALPRINFGNTYVAMGNYQMALKEYEAALNIQRMSLPSNQTLIARILHNIATIHAHQKNMHEADKYLESAQTIANQRLSLHEPLLKLIEKTEGFLV